VLLSCSGKNTVTPEPSEETVQFTVGYESYWLRFSAKGVYITDQGNVYKYSDQGEFISWRYPPIDTISSDTLMGLLQRNRVLVGTVNPGTLDSMIRLAGPCLDAELSDVQQIYMDGVAVYCRAYQYDAETRRYRRAVLLRYGNTEQHNLAPEADSLLNILMPIVDTYWGQR
jgi:hypothetical protein